MKKQNKIEKTQHLEFKLIHNNKPESFSEKYENYEILKKILPLFRLLD